MVSKNFFKFMGFFFVYEINEESFYLKVFRIELYVIYKEVEYKVECVFIW